MIYQSVNQKKINSPFSEKFFVSPFWEKFFVLCLTIESLLVEYNQHHNNVTIIYQYINNKLYTESYISKWMWCRGPSIGGVRWRTSRGCLHIFLSFVLVLVYAGFSSRASSSTFRMTCLHLQRLHQRNNSKYEMVQCVCLLSVLIPFLLFLPTGANKITWMLGTTLAGQRRHSVIFQKMSFIYKQMKIIY